MAPIRKMWNVAPLLKIASKALRAHEARAHALFSFVQDAVLDSARGRVSRPNIGSPCSQTQSTTHSRFFRWRRSRAHLGCRVHIYPHVLLTLLHPVLFCSEESIQRFVVQKSGSIVTEIFYCCFFCRRCCTTCFSHFSICLFLLLFVSRFPWRPHAPSAAR